ncbi:MAG: MBL fold metallo-hydrolase [Anaerotignum sp.]
MNVTYLHHSGFSVETETKVLLFDYYTEGGRKAYFDPAAYGEKDIFVFVSHAHEDHYDRRILDWGNLPRVKYVLSSDVRTESEFQGEVLTVNLHESYEFGGIHIETLQSNDEGVAFLVKADGKTIYHAGDLNWWHWNGEPDDFNNDIERSYTTEINRLKGRQIDVAFVPADLRLQDKYFWAVNYFLKTVGAKVLFPMHFWGRFEVCDYLRELGYGETIMKITGENEKFEF